MSNPYLSRVNRTLAYVDVQLDIIDEPAAAVSMTTDRVLRAEAALNAAVLQLWQAMQLYWHEIAANYRLRELPPTLEALLAQFAAASLAAPEARELQALVSTENSWLNNLTRWHQEQMSAPGSSAVPPSDLISTLDIDSAAPVLNAVQLRQCLVALRELLARQREGMAEY